MAALVGMCDTIFVAKSIWTPFAFELNLVKRIRLEQRKMLLFKEALTVGTNCLCFPPLRDAPLTVELRTFLALTGIFDHIVAYHAKEVLVEGRHDDLLFGDEAYSFVGGFLVLFATDP